MIIELSNKEINDIIKFFDDDEKFMKKLNIQSLIIGNFAIYL